MSGTQIGLDIQCNRRRAVTLIELLVIVGVLIFIIAMLFPALSKAQRQSRTVTCLSNLHQLYMGYAAYLPLNQQQSLRYATTESALWPNVLRPTFPDVKDILLCPEASAPSFGFGSAKTSWGPYDSAHGSPSSMEFIGNTSSSYGFNGWLYAGEDESFSNRWFRTHMADRVPVFAESNWVDGWPPRSEGAGGELPPPAQAAGIGLSRFQLARHGQSINASFLDGHAEQIPLDRLAELKWSLPPRPERGELHRGTSWETR